MKRIVLVLMAMALLSACSQPVATDTDLDRTVVALSVERGVPESIELVDTYAIVRWPGDTVALKQTGSEWTICDVCMVVILELRGE
jgi:hypothetical protein